MRLIEINAKKTQIFKKFLKKTCQNKILSIQKIISMRI